MKKRSREINIFSMSALDLFASALGAFILITVILFPYFPNTGDSEIRVAEVQAKLEKAREELRKTKEALKECQDDKAACQAELAEAKFPHLDLVVAIDTTGSMRNPIAGLKQELAEMVEVLTRLAPSVGVGVVAFNDREQTPVLRTHDLAAVEAGTSAFTSLQRFIDSLKAGDAAGDNDDWPEAVGQALERAVRMPWRSGSEKRIVIVITDAPPYENRRSNVFGTASSFADDPRQMISGVWVDSEQTGEGEASAFLKELSRRGQGRYVIAGGSITSSILLALLGV